MERAIREAIEHAGANAMDYLQLWLDPCTRLGWARLMASRARMRKRRFGARWWEWRVAVLNTRCDALDSPRGCQAKNVVASVLDELRRGGSSVL